MTNPDPTRSGELYKADSTATPPWDIGAPQPELIKLVEEFPPRGPVVELGCGTGALALALAERGLQVLGVDMAPLAIERAGSRAAAVPLRVRDLVEFRVGDALHPSRFGRAFGAVFDSGFFHLFEPDERQLLARELAGALAPGGRYYLLGFAINSPSPNAPRQVREDELRTLFSPENGWMVLTIRPGVFVTRLTRGDVPAFAACLERVAGPPPDR